VEVGAHVMIVVNLREETSQQNGITHLSLHRAHVEYKKDTRYIICLAMKYFR